MFKNEQCSEKLKESHEVQISSWIGCFNGPCEQLKYVKPYILGLNSLLKDIGKYLSISLFPLNQRDLLQLSDSVPESHFFCPEMVLLLCNAVSNVYNCSLCFFGGPFIPKPCSPLSSPQALFTMPLTVAIYCYQKRIILENSFVSKTSTAVAENICTIIYLWHGLTAAPLTAISEQGNSILYEWWGLTLSCCLTQFDIWSDVFLHYIFCFWGKGALCWWARTEIHSSSFIL